MSKGAVRRNPSAPPGVALGSQQPQQTIQTLVAREGPIPDPQELALYEQIEPGSAGRIIAMAEREQALQHNLADRAQRSDLEHRNGVLAAQQTVARSAFISDILGQTFGFLIAGAALGAAVYAISVNAHPVVICALVGLPIASIINAVRGGNQAKAERTKQP